MKETSVLETEKMRGSRAKNWLHQLRMLGEDKVGKNPGWVIVWGRVKENKISSKYIIG